MHGKNGTKTSLIKLSSNIHTNLHICIGSNCNRLDKQNA